MGLKNFQVQLKKLTITSILNVLLIADILSLKVKFLQKMVGKDYCAPYQHKMDQKSQNLYQLQSGIGMEIHFPSLTIQ